MPGPTLNPENGILTVTDLEGDFNTFINPGLLEAPDFDDSPQEQIIYLEFGWSMFSTCISITEITNWDETTYPTRTMSGMFEQFLYKFNENGEDTLAYDNADDWSNLIIIKSTLGAAYLPEWNFDGIGVNLEEQGKAGIYQGWQIKMGSSNYYLKLTGPFHQPTNPNNDNFPMTNGWSIIGFPYYNTSINTEVFCQNFIDNVIIVKNYLGAAFLPEWNFNGIGDLVTGQGYHIKLENHTSPNQVNVVYQDGGTPPIEDTPTDEDPQLDDPIEDDNVIHVHDGIIHSDVDMTIKIPVNVIINVIPDLDIDIILKYKKNIINEFYNGGKQLNENSTTQFQKNTIASNASQNSNQEFITKQNTNKEEIVKENEFITQLSEIESRFPAFGDPSGYSIQARNVINNYFFVIKDKIFTGNKTCSKVLNELISKKVFDFSFMAFEPVGRLLIGRVNFKFKSNFIVGNTALVVHGDDTSTSIDEGLLANETPRIFFFSGQKYYLCSFVFNSGNLQFLDKKVLTVEELELSEPVLKPV